MKEHRTSIRSIPASGIPSTNFKIDNFDDIINLHTLQIEEMQKLLNESSTQKDELKTLQEKLESHERNVIATMGILFSLFIGISSSLSLFSFTKKTTLMQAIILIAGVLLTNITLALILIYMIKVLFTHKKEEPHTITLFEKPTQFFDIISYFFLTIIFSIVAIVFLVIVIRSFEVWVTS